MSSKVEEKPTFRGLLRHAVRNFVKNPAIPKNTDSNEAARQKAIQLWLLIQDAQRKVSRLQIAALEREERLTRMSKSLKRWKALAKRAGRCAREWESTAASYQDALRAQHADPANYLNIWEREALLLLRMANGNDSRMPLERPVRISMDPALAPAGVPSADGWREKVNAAHDMVSALCKRKREWIMSVPAREDYDPDLVITDGLMAAERRIKELEAARAAAPAPAPNTIPVPRASVLVQIYRNVYAAGLDGTGRRITAWDQLTPSEQALQESAMDAVLAALSPFLSPASNAESLQTQLDQAHRERLNAEQAIDRIEVARQAEKESLRNNHANELQGLRALLADAERRVTRLTRDNEALCGKRLEGKRS